MTGLILLAAGASTRLGEPKQNLVFNNKTLLQHALKTALDSDCFPVILVLSPDSASELPALTDTRVTIAINSEWMEGMASSIRCGLKQLLATKPDTNSCIFMVCDQPYVHENLLKSIVQVKSDSGKEIVPCAYKDTLGTPVLFDKDYFPELLALRGQEGAKKIIFRNRTAVTSVPFPLGAIDIDTAEDYKALLQTQKS